MWIVAPSRIARIGHRHRSVTPSESRAECRRAYSWMSASMASVIERIMPSARGCSGTRLPSWYHDVMAKNLTVRLDDQLAADAEAIARAEGLSLNETVKQALREAVERRRKDPKFKARLRRIIEEDRELLE